MIPCIMIGDSIAYGVGQARPECETVARVGISSGRYVSALLPPGRTVAGTAVISLGVNDGDTADTLENLRTVRERIQAQSVVWLLPGLKQNVRDMIRTVAAENGDRTLDTRPEVGRDHLHPTGAGYQRIANATLGESDAGVEVAYAPDETLRTPHRRTARHARALRHRNRVAVHGQASRARTTARPGLVAGPGHKPLLAAKSSCAPHCRSRAVRS